MSDSFSIHDSDYSDVNSPNYLGRHRGADQPDWLAESDDEEIQESLNESDLGTNPIDELSMTMTAITSNGNSSHYLPSQLIAETILIRTSLQVDIIAFFDGRHMAQLLNCKKLTWVNLDTNKDVINANQFATVEVLNRFDNLQSPPVLAVDGVVLGDFLDVSELENDGVLDPILARQMCPCCGGERDDMVCMECEHEFNCVLGESDYSRLDVIQPREIKISEMLSRGFTYDNKSFSDLE